MTKTQITAMLDGEQLELLDAFARECNLSRSRAVSCLVSAGLAAVDRDAAEAGALERRLDEIAAVAYANHALVEWYLPQAFRPSDKRPRPKMLRDLSLAASSDYFLALGEAMSRNRGNIAFALADTGGNGNDFEIDVKANDFAGRADFCAFYRNAGIGIESTRAQRDARKRREQGPGTPVANGSQPA